MKPILVLWLAVLMLICLWIVADPATAAEKARKESKENCCLAKIEKQQPTQDCYAKSDCAKFKP